MNAMARPLILFITRVAVLCVLVFLFSSPLTASDKTTYRHQNIRIPLGLAWGELPQNLESIAKSGGFTIVHREENGDKTTLTVHGLVGTALKETLFIYKKNALVEIEYRYGNPSWKKQNYQDFFDSFRRMYDEKYGAGNVLTPSTARKKDPFGITTSLVGYEWNQASCNLDLFYFSAEGSTQSYRLISLHYKAP